MDYNVLVLAMSILPRGTVGSKRITSYQFKKDGIKSDEVYKGVGQMEVVPIMLHQNLQQEDAPTRITHLLILETEKTRQPIEFDGNTAEAFRLLKQHYGSMMNFDGLKSAKEITHVDFFKSRMRYEGIMPHYEDIRIEDDDDPSPAFEQLQTRIRELYAECIESRGHWHLWIDTHGAFREISMIMVGLMQMLAAPDEQDLARYVEGEPLKSDAVARMSDGLATIPIEALYCSEFDQEKALRGECQIIADRTDFYQTFTKPAITAYMNYGQYAHMVLRSGVQRDPAGNVLPYAFVSYRSADAPKERFALLGALKLKGYRYWYDDSIRLQKDWAKELEVANEQSAVFIGLVTKGYAASYQCMLELRHAIDKDKLILLAALDQTSPYSLRDGGKGICLQPDDGEGKPVVISDEELAAILSKQHLVLNKLVTPDGVFQEENLLYKLRELRSDEEAFASIIADKPRRTTKPGGLANCTNHPKSSWSESQLNAASAYGEVIDLPFPAVDPALDPEGVRELVRDYADRILESGCDAALVAGEFTLTYMLVDKLLREGKTVLCTCSRRRTTEEVAPDGSVHKSSVFVFERFRPYEPFEPL